MPEPENHDETLTAALAEIMDVSVDDLAPGAVAVEDVAEEVQEDAEDAREPADDEDDTEDLEAPEAALEGAEDDEAETEDTPEPEAIPYGERTELVAALARDGLPQRMIETLSDTELLAYGAKRRKSQADVDSIKADMLTYKQQLQSGDTPGTEGAPTEPDKPSPIGDVSKLVESFGEEEATEISAYVQNQVTAATAPLLEALGGMVDNAQKSRLSGVVPEGQAFDYDRVRSSAIKLGETDLYADLDRDARTTKLFDLALHAEYPDLPSPAELAKQERLSAAKRRGVATRGGNKRAVEKKLTGDALVTAKAMAAIKGMTASAIRDKYGG